MNVVLRPALISDAVKSSCLCAVLEFICDLFSHLRPQVA